MMRAQACRDLSDSLHTPSLFVSKHVFPQTAAPFLQDMLWRRMVLFVFTFVVVSPVTMIAILMVVLVTIAVMAMGSVMLVVIMVVPVMMAVVAIVMILVIVVLGRPIVIGPWPFLVGFFLRFGRRRAVFPGIAGCDVVARNARGTGKAAPAGAACRKRLAAGEKR